MIYGRILDEDGRAIADAQSEFEDSSGTTRSTEVDENDWHLAFGLHPGTWSVTVTAPGFQTFENEIVLSDRGSRIRYDAVLTRSTIVSVTLATARGEDLNDVLGSRLDTSCGSIVTAVATAEAPSIGIARGPPLPCDIGTDGWPPRTPDRCTSSL